MRKKLFGIFLVTIFSIAMCACGSKQENPSMGNIAASTEISENQEAVKASSGTTTASGTEAKATEAPKSEELTSSKSESETPEAKVTEAPETTAKPQAAEATATPKPTATPGTAPQETVKATASPKPAATQGPDKAVEAPKATEAPRVTEAPKATVEPTSTPAPAHTHTYVDKVISEATCTEAKVVGSVCSVCGASNGTRTEGNALGHDLYEDWFNQPGCLNGGWVTERCHRCNYASGHAGTPLGHDWEETSIAGSDCTTPGVTTKTCKRCGWVEEEANDQYGPHDWQVETWTEINWDTLQEEEKSAVVCQNCNARQ